MAVDVGGTFTDFVYMAADGSLRFHKRLSTPRSPELAVIEGIAFLGGAEEVVHASTVGTNALRGQEGLELPRVGLLVTKGFRDIIEIGRQNRPKLYDPFFEKPRPLVPRELRVEVEERVDFAGRVLTPLRAEEAEEAARRLEELGAESVAISFLHSYANPQHERRAKEVLLKRFSYVTASHEVAPEPREYERTSTAVVNAALMPLLSRYLQKLEEGLRELGVRRLYVMSSSGGLVDVREASERPVQLVESGPAAGVVASAELARALGIPDVISFDMGGTTAKAGTVLNYEFEVTAEYEVGGEAHHGRIVKGSGYPVRFPFIDLAEVSAGGGTIIWRDEAGALRVGPVSAGADPGPACYGRGGKRPTVTDANVALGRLERLLGGSMELDKGAALRALSELGDPEQVALGAVQLANLEMARAIRLVTVERGLDPSRFSLIAFGGAGPQHAMEVAEELGIRSVIVPPHPGLFSALGLLLADWRFEARLPFPADLEGAFARLEEELARKAGEVDYFVRYADVRYEGQGWELTVPIGRPARLEEVRRTFEEKHLAVYGFRLEREVEVVVARAFAVRRRRKASLPRARREGEVRERGRRRVIFREGREEAPVFLREELPMGAELEGPAVIEEYDSVTVVPPGWRARVGELGELRGER
ncbi:MAG: hydantoinase/oxoprolinase family protein [Acidilobaceae archaeon]|nr:hydantoinase/oxoprolinase family protein [Acidilobaceae archaeon]